MSVVFFDVGEMLVDESRGWGRLAVPETFERLLAAHVDVTGSSQRWRVSKPDPAFFERVIEAAREPPERIAYVGDRVGNDVAPAKRAGMLAVHVRRGPWGHLQDASGADIRLDSLAELPEALRRA